MNAISAHLHIRGCVYGWPLCALLCMGHNAQWLSLLLLLFRRWDYWFLPPHRIKVWIFGQCKKALSPTDYDISYRSRVLRKKSGQNASRVHCVVHTKCECVFHPRECIFLLWYWNRSITSVYREVQYARISFDLIVRMCISKLLKGPQFFENSHKNLKKIIDLNANGLNYCIEIQRVDCVASWEFIRSELTDISKVFALQLTFHNNFIDIYFYIKIFIYRWSLSMIWRKFLSTGHAPTTAAYVRCCKRSIQTTIIPLAKKYFFTHPKTPAYLLLFL